VTSIIINGEDLVARFPDTRIDHDTKYFYNGWLNRQLVFNRCADCGEWHAPPKPVCPKCWSFNIVPTAIGGKGTIHLLSRLYMGPPAPDVDYKAGPHPVATVELDEQPGLRYTSTVINCPTDKIQIGMRIQLAWIERYGAPYPVFEPLREA
jgi:uncharacterized OB-fold protein